MGDLYNTLEDLMCQDRTEFARLFRITALERAIRILIIGDSQETAGGGGTDFLHFLVAAFGRHYGNIPATPLHPVISAQYFPFVAGQPYGIGVTRLVENQLPPGL